jgi:LysM repeat protein
MKILQIFGAVVAVHLLAFIFIFASPGCQSGPRNIPTPDATMPAGGTAAAPVSFNVATPQPVDLGTAPVGYNPASPAGHAAPTRPGSANAVAITPAKPTAEVTSINTYTVGRGDSLYTIAKKHNLTVAELAKANNLSAGVVMQPGKKLIIPVKPGAAPVVAPATEKARDLGTLTQAAPARGEAIRHTVAPGEPLSVIARKYGITLGELAAANNITDPQKVRAGQVLIIPGFKAVGSKNTTSSKSTTTATTAPKSTAPAEIPSVSTSAKPATTAPANPTPHFEIAPPPPGQDLDAGIKPQTTEVPTIKVEETTPPKN